MHAAIGNALLFMAWGIVFTLFDCYGYGVLVSSGKLATWKYRVIQCVFNIAGDAGLIVLGYAPTAIGFEIAHFCFGWDWLYYFFREENFSGYTITWFPLSLPSLIFRVMGKPFKGTALEWIGPAACLLGMASAVLFSLFLNR